ncbi:MAG: enoyl-CoA hydratase/isomerase family protein [Deltaproteobacteria bacterium]|nr:enoyl-CoA hydratase/isomerase family protein [Deltaproteobacteria bacterium]
MYEQILIDKQDGYAKIIFNRPETRNAITPLFMDELETELKELDADDSINVIFLTGAGDDFCAGMDLKYALDTLQNRPDAFRVELIPKGPRVDDLIEGLRKPVIAAVQGNAVAGGFILAYFCDLIIAEEDAKFGDAHAKWGFVPGWQEPQRLARKIGIRRAREFFLTAELVSAERAKEMGLVWKVVPTGGLEEAVAKWGAKYKKLNLEALSMMKQQLKSMMRADWQSVLDFDLLMRKDLIGGFCTEDAAARLKTFGKK